MTYVALITLLLALQLMVFTMMVGAARAKHKVDAPAMTGSTEFECSLRVQLNTLEQLMVALPALWVCAMYFSPNVAAILGVVFFVGRIIYAIGYKADTPMKRGPGMILGMLATVGMIGCGLWGIVGKLI